MTIIAVVVTVILGVMLVIAITNALGLSPFAMANAK